MVISICVHTPRKSISTSRLEKRRTSNPSAVKNAEPPGVFHLTVVLWYGHGFPSQSAAPTALPKGEPSSARNALHRTVYRSAPLLSVRQREICLFLLFRFWGWQFIIHCMKQACQKFLIINFIYQQHLFCSLIG